MKNYSKRMLAFVLALVVALTAVIFTASANDDYSDEYLVLKTELLKEVGGEFVPVGKVEPGDELKARISIGISYYTTAADILVFYDETFFEDSYATGETEFSPVINTESAQCSKLTAMLTKLDDSVKVLQKLVTNGYLEENYLDTHQAFIYNIFFTDSVTHTFSEDEWIFELDLKVREDADGTGEFGFVYDTVARAGTHESAYINVQYNTVNGDKFSSTALYNLDIPTTITNAVATTLEEPATTLPAETTTEKEEISTLPQVSTTAAEVTTTVPDESTTAIEESTTASEYTTVPEEDTTVSGEGETTVPEATDAEPTTTPVGNETTVAPSEYPTHKPTAVPTVPSTAYPTAVPTTNNIGNLTTNDFFATTVPTEPTTKFDISIGIRNPSEKVIKYGDGIILHAETSKTLPDGYSIVWEADNDCFTMTPSEDGKTCTVISAVSGTTTFNAKVVDEDGNVVATSGNRLIQSKAGLFWKIIAFFKKIFGLTKLYPEFIF